MYQQSDSVSAHADRVSSYQHVSSRYQQLCTRTLDFDVATVPVHVRNMMHQQSAPLSAGSYRGGVQNWKCLVLIEQKSVNILLHF